MIPVLNYTAVGQRPKGRVLVFSAQLRANGVDYPLDMIDTLLIGYLRLRRSNVSHPHFGPSQDLRFRTPAQKKAEGTNPETQARARFSAKGASRAEKAKTQKALDVQIKR